MSDDSEYCYKPGAGFGGSIRALAALLAGRAFVRHEWERESYGKRVCSKCGQHQTLFQKRYTEVGEASLNWRDTWRKRS